MAFDMPESNLLGFIFEALFYGAYVFVFIEHMRVLYRKRSKTWPYFYFQTTSVLLFVLITAHMVVDIVRAMRAFTGDMGTPNSPMAFFEEFNTLDSRIRTGIYDAVTLVSDLFLVYRCFIVWGSNYFVALVPFLLFVTDIVIAAWATDSLNRTRSGDHFSMTLVGLRAKYMFIVTLALNLLCTVLIAYRIWYIQRQVAGYDVHTVHPQQKLSNVIIIIIESAAIYSGILIALIVTDITGSPSFFMLLNLISPVIGLVFSAIIVRSGSSNDDYTSNPKSTFKFDPRTSATATIGGTRLERNTGVHIHLETISHKSPSDRVGDENSHKQPVDIV